MPEPEEGLFSLGGVPLTEEQEEAIIDDPSPLPALLAAAEGPARRGTVLQLFVSAPVETGEIRVAGEPEVRIGNIAAQVLSSDFAPGMAGLRRIQVVVPADAPVGRGVPVSVFYPGVELPTTHVAVE